MKKSIVVALAHLILVLSLGGKLLYDRATRPRVWVRTASFDPDLPIRGRYAALRVQVRAPWMKDAPDYQNDWVTLSEEKGELVARKSDSSTGVLITHWQGARLPAGYGALQEPLLFFLPEHVRDPSWVQRGQELWVEVTLPRKGPPRPIQLAIKDEGGWHPLTIR
ncbi:MAG: hypothetical protein LAP21_21880 [Acidobacteriia bacterium]|nr:hypothetical protein [Terriglobia bacterium]